MTNDIQMRVKLRLTRVLFVAGCVVQKNSLNFNLKTVLCYTGQWIEQIGVVRAYKWVQMGTDG